MYEGFEYSDRCIYTGAAPNQNALQLARFLMERQERRVLMVGSDYVFPHESNRVMADRRTGFDPYRQPIASLTTSEAEVATMTPRAAAARGSARRGLAPACGRARPHPNRCWAPPARDDEGRAANAGKDPASICSLCWQTACYQSVLSMMSPTSCRCHIAAWMGPVPFRCTPSPRRHARHRFALPARRRPALGRPSKPGGTVIIVSSRTSSHDNTSPNQSPMPPTPIEETLVTSVPSSVQRPRAAHKPIVPNVEPQQAIRRARNADPFALPDLTRKPTVASQPQRTGLAEIDSIQPAINL